MRIRILDRILVAIAGLLLVAACAGLIAQVFFNVDIAGTAAKLIATETTTGKIIAGVCAGILFLLGAYCVLLLFRHRRRKDKFILQKLESGDLAISLKTMESMVEKCIAQHDEIKTESIRLENQRDGLLIRIRGTVAGGISIPLTADTLQKQIKQYVTACSGVEVKGIRLQIESSGEDAKDAPFAIEPPTNNLLSRGGETTEKRNAEAVPPEWHETGAAAEPDAKPEAAAETEKSGEAGQAAAAAAMAAAESVMGDLDPEDDRPIHQRLFSTQEEPCIVPMPPEAPAESEAAAVESEGTEEPADSAEEKEKEAPAAEELTEEPELKGEEEK